MWLYTGYQESELRYLTFLYTCPLTILFAAEQAGLASGPVQDAVSLTIHLVGARVAEIRLNKISNLNKSGSLYFLSMPFSMIFFTLPSDPEPEVEFYIIL